ncbi:MAG: MqnA/MqnD/SBP family protein, partial [Rhodothermales bacterium]|nr:MqnA/MqnD/SBP family protein [Rhodothermales bacterium]
MRIGIEDNRAAEFLVAGLGDDSSPTVVRLPRQDTLRAVRAGQLDLALVPALSVLRDPEDLEVVPAVALSSWRYPFAQLYLPGGLDTAPSTICYQPTYHEEAELARIVVKEHYGLTPDFRPCDGVLEKNAATVLVGDSVGSGRPRGLYLDLGQEWCELANYPMVSGLFVMAHGTVSADIVRSLRGMAAEAETLRAQWAAMDDGRFRRFFLDDVRVRFDDLVVASLTQLSDFAFYYDIIDEIRDIPIASVDVSNVDGD